MAKDTTYSYKPDSLDFVIENGILKGASEPLTYNSSNNYGEVILECLRSNPEFVGQIDGITGSGETLREMMEKSVKCALWLRKHDIRPGDVVGICTHNQMDMYIPLLASLYIGAVFNPWWDSGLTRDLARHFVTLTRPKILFIHEASLDVALQVIKEFNEKPKIIIFGNKMGFDCLETILLSQEPREYIDKFTCTKLRNLDVAAFIVYTSGTTGLPKGIVTTQKSVFGNSPNFIELGRIKSMKSVISINFSSISWGGGIACLLRSFVVPETRIIYPEFQSEITLRLIEDYKINLMHLSPRKAFKLQKSLEISNYDVSSLKLFWISGGVLKKEMQDSTAASFPMASVYQAYGTSELAGVAFRQKYGFKPNSCGKITKNITMKVIDLVTGKILGPNELGEACFKSPFMMSEYLKNPVATRKAIDSEGWLHSGDLVHYDEEGNVYITDRVSEMFNYGGRYVSPETIEQAMQIHPDIFDIAIVGINDGEENGEIPVAFVTKTPGSKVTEEELEKLLYNSLPDCKNFRGRVKFLDAVPRLLSGKVARGDLKKLAISCTH